MSTQAFQLHPSLAGLSPTLLKKRYDEMTPEERRALGFTRPATAQEFASAQIHGAPADFGGPVYTSATPPVISEDTDPGIPETQMPTGVTMQRQNSTGSLPLNASNPPAAALNGAGLQTIGAKFDPAAPYQKETAKAGTAKFDPSATYEADASGQTPPTPPAKPGFWERAYETSGAKGLIEQAKQRDADLRAMYSRVGDHLQQGDFGGALSELAHHAGKVALQTGEEMPAVNILKSQASQIPKAIAAAKAGDLSTAAGRGLAAITPLVGPAAADAGEKLGTDVGEGNFAGAAGDVAGVAAPLLVAKGVEAAPEIASGINDAAVAGVRAVGKGIQKAASSDLGQAIGDTASQIAAGADPDVIGLASPRAAHALRLAAKTGRVVKANTPAEALAAPPAEVLNAPVPQLPEGFFPRAPYQEPVGTAGNPFKAPTPPEAPAAQPAASGAQETAPEIEDLEGQASPQTENASASPLEASPADVLSKKASPAELKALLENSLGAKPLKKGVSLRNQNQPTVEAAPAPATAATAPLPKDFTPASKSSVIKGYHYDPEVREFHTVTNAGDHYIYGDVEPEAAAKFEANDSKGRAWNDLRNTPGVTRVATVTNGVRQAYIPSKSLLDMPPADALAQKVQNLQDFLPSQKLPSQKLAAASPTELGAPAASPDLTTDWSKALADVQAKKSPNAAAARAGATESPEDALAREGDADAQIKAQRIQRATQIIKDPESTYEQRVQAYGDLQDADLGPSKIAEIAKDVEARAQAGKTRKMAQPRTEVAAPTATRKPNLTVEQMKEARRLQRKKSGA